MGCGSSVSVQNEHILPDLFDLNPEEISLVPNQGQTIPARVIDVYDGDTFTVIFYYGKQPFKIKVRLDGLDTPEMKPRKVQDGITRTEEELRLEKASAVKIKEWVKSLILEKEVSLTVIKWGKFGGRMLCQLSFANQDLTSTLVKKGWAREYHGEKKTPWTVAELQAILEK